MIKICQNYGTPRIKWQSWNGSGIFCTSFHLSIWDGVPIWEEQPTLDCQLGTHPQRTALPALPLAVSACILAETLGWTGRSKVKALIPFGAPEKWAEHRPTRETNMWLGGMNAKDAIHRNHKSHPNYCLKSQKKYSWDHHLGHCPC